MENLNVCPVCSSAKFNKLFNCKDYVSSSEYFTINECENCCHKFTNPRPDEKEIAKYYLSDKYISHAGSNKSKLGVTYKIYDLVRNYSISSKLKLIKKYHKQGNLLDLGCGLGHFLNGVKQDKTFNGTGADVSDDALTFIKTQFGIDAIKEDTLINFNDNYFEVITQWHVLEHVHRLGARMIELKRLLSEDGTILIAVPNSKSFDAAYYNAFWDAYDVPRHLHHFNSKSFTVLMKKYGFKVIAQKGMFFDGPYVSIRSENHKQHRLAIIRGGIIGLISNIISWFTGNYSSILYIIKHE